MSFCGLTSPFLYTVWQMEEAESRGALYNMGSLMQTHRSSPTPAPSRPSPADSPSRPRSPVTCPSFCHCLGALRPISAPCTTCQLQEIPREGTRKSHIPRNPLARNLCFPFTGPAITQKTDCIHLGNIDCGQGLCMNSTDSLISDSFTDMSCPPSDGSLSVTPHLCHGEGSAHTSRVTSGLCSVGTVMEWDSLVSGTLMSASKTRWKKGIVSSSTAGMASPKVLCASLCG